MTECQRKKLRVEEGEIRNKKQLNRERENSKEKYVRIMKIGSDNLDKDYLLCKIHSYPKHRRRFTARNEIYAINFRHFLTDATLLRTCHATRIPRNTFFLLSFSFFFFFSFFIFFLYIAIDHLLSLHSTFIQSH